jgi:hypothetical protein
MGTRESPHLPVATLDRSNQFDDRHRGGVHDAGTISSSPPETGTLG